jgi:tetratricopeptide (TPR) repeat protein
MNINACCAECGAEGGVSLKMRKACMSVKYCDAACQRKHWATHKKECKLRAAELRDEALFKDPPAKENCPICFLPMTRLLLSCVSLPPATIMSVLIHDFAMAHEELADKAMEVYYPCCGKSICKGCIYSFCVSGNEEKCPFCNAKVNATAEQHDVEIRKRVEANDAASINLLAFHYHHGLNGYQEDHGKAKELYARSADLGCSDASYALGSIYRRGGDMKKAKFHYEAAAIAGHEVARYNLGVMEYKLGNVERAVKHWTIAASAGYHTAMHELLLCFEEGAVSKESINSILAAYNNSCAELRSEARDAYLHNLTD